MKIVIVGIEIDNALEIAIMTLADMPDFTHAGRKHHSCLFVNKTLARCSRVQVWSIGTSAMESSVSAFSMHVFAGYE